MTWEGSHFSLQVGHSCFIAHQSTIHFQQYTCPHRVALAIVIKSKQRTHLALVSLIPAVDTALTLAASFVTLGNLTSVNNELSLLKLPINLIVEVIMRTPTQEASRRRV